MRAVTISAFGMTICAAELRAKNLISSMRTVGLVHVMLEESSGSIGIGTESGLNVRSNAASCVAVVAESFLLPHRVDGIGIVDKIPGREQFDLVRSMAAVVTIHTRAAECADDSIVHGRRPQGSIERRHKFEGAEWSLVSSVAVTIMAGNAEVFIIGRVIG